MKSCISRHRVKISPMLDPTHCRNRQRRLLEFMQQHRMDAVVLSSTPHAYYFSGHWPFWQHHAAVILFADGRSALVSANLPKPNPAVDEAHAYEATWFSTQRQEQPTLLAGKVQELLRMKQARRVGLDASPISAVLERDDDRTDFFFIDYCLFQLRRKKDPDELAIMKKAIECTRAMYERAKEIIEPGVPEITVYNELHAAATRVAGGPLSAYLGNDFACGVPGGAAREGRVAQPGEIYILDLGPAVAGYFSDNCRAFAVDRKLTDAQQKAYEHVIGAFPIVEQMAKPGVKCREIFAAVNQYYRSKLGKEFTHHLGHGVGLQPHEFPHLNPKWDDTLQEGEIFTAEPGLYGPDLAGGLRIENQYLVTATGVENLTPFPTELA